MANEHPGGNNRQFNPPDTLVRSTHSLSIKTANGVTIGLINGWAPNMSRQVTPVYEINIETSGLPYENIPGNTQNLTLTVQRYDVWLSRMETAFGTRDLVMLSNQKSPFKVREVWTSPDGTDEKWEYSGCWFESLGRTFRSDDTRIVNVNATLRYVNKIRV